MATADQYAEWIVNNADKKGTPDFEIVAQAYKQAKAEESAPAAAPERSIGQQALRQVGLTARYGLESLGNTAQFWSEPFRKAQEFVTGKPVVGGGQLASNLADTIGLPSPETKQERIVGDVTRGIGSIASGGGAGQILQKTGTKFAQGVGTALNADPLKQAAAATGAGALGGSVRENGGSPLEELGAAILGSFAGLAGASAVGSVADKAKAVANLFMRPQVVDQQLSLALAKSGIDYSQVSETVRASLRKDLKSALLTGKPLDTNALARLADFRATGTTPTRGMLTLDPIQVTKEQNLAKTGANSVDGVLHGLPRAINDNNAKLIQNLNALGASDGSVVRAGESAVSSIAGRDAAWQAANKGLYDSARSMPGGSTPLNTGELVQNIYSEVAKSGKAAFLPDNVYKLLHQLQTGKAVINGVEVPVNFDATGLDNLMTAIATAQRGTADGNVKAALSAVRRAIDGTAVSPVKPTFGGNQLVTQGVADSMQAVDGQAAQYMDALNKARASHAARMQWGESSRPVEAALSGAEGYNFVKKFVINGSPNDAAAVAANAPREPVRNAILAHLKDKALNGAADEVGKFSQSAFNKALKELEETGKLRLFFTPQEIATLKANGRVASYMQFQPAGSAVNNSNSGALLLGKLGDLAGLGLNSTPILKDVIVGVKSRHALQAPKAVIADQSQTLLPLALGANAGLLAAPPR